MFHYYENTNDDSDDSEVKEREEKEDNKGTLHFGCSVIQASEQQNDYPPVEK